MEQSSHKPSPAFVAASWGALFIGVLAYSIGLWRAKMLLNEKGYYFAVLLLGLFSAVSLQKAVRDKAESVPVTSVYFGMCWVALGAALLLMTVGLWNAHSIVPSEKGFYGMAFTLSLFAAVAVQKNVRDTGREATSGGY